jgi:Transposase zinc-binding domain
VVGPRVPGVCAEASTGAELPRFVKDEFDAFLECGILAHGFLRLRCGECGHDKLLAFSCKRRGFCPSSPSLQAAVGRSPDLFPRPVSGLAGGV